MEDICFWLSPTLYQPLTDLYCQYHVKFGPTSPRVLFPAIQLIPPLAICCQALIKSFSLLQSAASLIICHCRGPAINNMLSFSASRRTVLLTIKATLHWTISEQVEDFALAIILSCNYGSYENYVFAVGYKSERPGNALKKKEKPYQTKDNKG